MQRYHWFFLLYIFLITILLFFDFVYVLPKTYIYIPFILSLIPIIIEAIKQIKTLTFGTEFFLTIAAIIGLLGDEVRAATIVLIIMLIAEFFDHLVEEQVTKSVKSLVSLLPEKVTIQINNTEKEMFVNEINIGMNIIVKAGGQIPVDGIVIKGAAQINESSLTGESLPREKTINEEVFAGTFIDNGSLIVKATKVGKDTFFGKIRTLIEESEKTKARIANLSSKVARILVPSILIFILFIWFLTGNSKLVLTLLVFGSPLELTLITPLTILAATAAAFKQGILIKGGKYLEQLAQIDTIVFDKTGTLTCGHPEVVEIQSLNQEYDQKSIVFFAAIAEKLSSHLLAKAVLRRAHELDLEIPDPEAFKTIIGHGVEIIYKNKYYFLGTKHFMEHSEYANIKLPDMPCKSNIEPMGAAPHTIFYLACKDKFDSRICGKICVADQIRQEAKSTINDLKEEGVKQIYIVSGDNQAVVDSLASCLNIEHAFGNMLPDQKIEVIKELQKGKHIVAMVGDGINDAPSIKQANIGIAMGAMGMEPAIDAADVVLMTNDLKNLIFVYRLSKRALTVIKQNIFFGFGLIHILGMILAFFSLINPIQAAIFHAIEDLAILINSVRLINFKK